MKRSWSGRSRSRPRSGLRKLADYGLTAVLLGLPIVLAARLDQSETRTVQGQAVVSDGDSIRLGAERIRLRGIDAPEFEQTCRKDGADYACGRLSRDALRALVGNGPVSCEGHAHDRYGRLLGDCMAGGVDLNRGQVRAGWAVAYGDFAADERMAKTARAGIWAGTFERPQDWRRQHGQNPEPAHDDVLARIGDWLRESLRFW